MINQDFGDNVKEILPEATLLGKIVAAPKRYDPSILVAVPRSQNRELYGITNKDFDGNDLWRCYECSTITIFGMPVYFIMTIQYPSDSEFIVESKSLKLYLNSFNNTKSRHANKNDVIREYLKKVKEDLDNLLKTNTRVYSQSMTGLEGVISMDEQLGAGYKNLEDIVDYSLIASEGYTRREDLLKKNALREGKNSKFKFEGFRSNCKITNQPDYATVFIKINSYEGIDPVSLVKYLTSFRNENHFHEECCEIIFKDINSFFTPHNLSVTCCYTRRGGIDISPTRSIKEAKHTGVFGTTLKNEEYI